MQAQRHDRSAPAWGLPSPVRLFYAGTVTAPLPPAVPLEQAFVGLRPTLERYLRARGAGDQAEDMAQELWLKIAALPDGIDVSDPASYLFRMAHNLMLDRRRAEVRRRVRERHYVELVDSAGVGVDPAATPERAFAARRELQAVQAVLAGLGERTDFIFRRHRIDGIGQRQIATELGITLSAVEKHLQKAYKAIHAAQREGDEHGPT
ncbi:RNA polymerase sigma factor [Sphingomonas oryzagri]